MDSQKLVRKYVIIYIRKDNKHTVILIDTLLDILNLLLTLSSLSEAAYDLSDFTSYNYTNFFS